MRESSESAATEKTSKFGFPQKESLSMDLGAGSFLEEGRIPGSMSGGTQRVRGEVGKANRRVYY